MKIWTSEHVFEYVWGGGRSARGHGVTAGWEGRPGPESRRGRGGPQEASRRRAWWGELGPSASESWGWGRRSRPWGRLRNGFPGETTRPGGGWGRGPGGLPPVDALLRSGGVVEHVDGTGGGTGAPLPHGALQRPVSRGPEDRGLSRGWSLQYLRVEFLASECGLRASSGDRTADLFRQPFDLRS